MDIKFQLANGLVYPGISGGGKFMGEELVYVTKSVRSKIVRDITEGLGPWRLANAQSLRAKISSAPINPTDRLISLWGVSLTVLNDLCLFEYKSSGAAGMDAFSGHYFDVVVPDDSQMEIGSSSQVREGLIRTYLGRFSSIVDAMHYLNGRGVSQRTSKLEGVDDDEVQEGSVLARRYASPYRASKELCDVVSEIPVNVIQSDGDYAERWARQQLIDARTNEPDIEWIMGITSLMIEVDKCRQRVKSSVSSTAEKRASDNAGRLPQHLKH